MVVLEAMAHGLPVVVSNETHCGIAELLTDGDNALLLKDPRDASELAFKLRSLLQNQQRTDDLSQRAVTFAAEHQWAGIARAQEAMYFEVLRVRQPKPTSSSPA